MSWLSDFNERWAPDMAESASRRGWLLWCGVVVLVAGLLAAGFLWSAGNDRRRNAIEGFARAPVGCDTTLDFAETGEYLVFIESAGRLNGLRGDCDVEGAYDLGSVTPAVEITVVDPDGAPVKLNPAVGGPNYSEAGFVGAAAFTIEIVETDDHVVRVESTDNEVFVIAVGRDPSEGVGLLRGGSGGAGNYRVAAGWRTHSAQLAQTGDGSCCAAVDARGRFPTASVRAGPVSAKPSDLRSSGWPSTVSSSCVRPVGAVCPTRITATRSAAAV